VLRALLAVDAVARQAREPSIGLLTNTDNGGDDAQAFYGDITVGR
jgi:hypothetical protein